MTQVAAKHKVGHTLMFTWRQIVEGDATCAYCQLPAVVLLATGADPDLEPACFVHWRLHERTSALTTEKLFGRGT